MNDLERNVAEPETMLAPGTPVVIRIAAFLVSTEAPIGWTVDYLGTRIKVANHNLVARPDANLLALDLDASIIRATGRASYLVNCGGHRLPVHSQQVREILAGVGGMQSGQGRTNGSKRRPKYGK
jgi:hypothetical protein